MAPKSGSSLGLSASPVAFFAHLLVIAVTTLVLVWLLNFRGGLAFQSKTKLKIFNLHPLLMAVGFVLIGGEAIMAYKTIPAERQTQKTIHLILHLVALVSGIVGIYAVFKFHNELSYPHMNTLHSWIGMSAICLYGLQFLLGFVSFVFPRAQSFTRARIAPWHVFAGIVIFLMAIISAETGLMEDYTFLNLGRSQEALIINFTGLLILLYGIAVSLTVILPKY